MATGDLTFCQPTFITHVTLFIVTNNPFMTSFLHRNGALPRYTHSRSS